MFINAVIVRFLKSLLPHVFLVPTIRVGGLLFLSLFLSSSFYLCRPVSASEVIVIELQLNTEEKGEFFVVLEDDGNFLLKPEDLAGIGLQDIAGEIVVFQDEEYISLKTLKNVSFELDEVSLVLQLESDPALLPVQFVDMSPVRKEAIYYPRETSVFFNYGIDYLSAFGANSDDMEVLTLANELGIRHKDVLFLNNMLYTDTALENSLVRLHTNFTQDRREEMQRLIVGDLFASSGTLGGQINAGGLGFSKNYRINPYFFENPLFSYSGFLTLPSDVELYVDGIRFKTEHLSPGQFDLQNFESSGGGRDIEVVIRDSLGREQRISAPFYFTDQLLRKNLHEYSYNMGFLREEFGQESNRYSHLAVSLWHRYGFTDAVSFGGRFEGGDGLLNLGTELFCLVDRYGVLRMDIAGSHLDSESGWGSLFGYEYRSRYLSTRFFYRNYSDSYRNFNRLDADKLVKTNLNFGISYTARKLGTLACDFSKLSFVAGEDTTIYSVSHSKQMRRNLYLTTTLRRIDSEESNTEMFLNLSYNFDAEHSASSRLYVSDENSTQVLEAHKNVPAGVGVGWLAALEGEQLSSSDSYAINTAAQQNGRYGIYRGELRVLTGDDIDLREEVRLSTSGALVYVGRSVHPTRPVVDSFSLVKVGDIDKVRVRLNGQNMGRTDENGTLIIPTMNSYFDNQISIEDQDIPIDYLMLQTGKTLSPPFRSGSCSYFPVEKYQAYMGQLISRDNETIVPLEYYEASFVAGSRTISFNTGPGGEFYFDNDPSTNSELLMADGGEGCEAILEAKGFVYGSGAYQGQAKTDDGRSCSFELTISASEESYIDMGEVFCQIEPSAESEGESPGEGSVEVETTDADYQGQPLTAAELPDEEM